MVEGPEALVQFVDQRRWGKALGDFSKVFEIGEKNGRLRELLRRGGANPAAIAVAAQIPSLFTVAFITQFAVAFWFLVGVAVSWPVLGPLTRGSRRRADE